MQVITPEQRALIPDALANLARALAGSTDEHIATVLGTVSCALPKRQTEQDAEAMLRVYTVALRDIPPDLLSMAGIEAVKSLKYFPKVAELRELAMKELSRRLSLKYKLELLARKHDEEYRDPIAEPMVEPEQLAKLAKQLGRRFPSRRQAA